MSGAGLKILVLADSRSFHIERYAAELRRHECVVLIASLESGTVAHIPLRRRSRVNTFAYALAAGETARLIDSFQPDIIDAHYASGYGFLLSRLRGRPRPAVLHLWGSDILRVPGKSWFHKRKVIAALKAPERIVADSAFLADKAAALTRIRRPDVISWGIEARYLARHRSDYNLGRPLRVIVPRLHEPVYDNEFILASLKDLIDSGKIRLTFPAFGSGYESFAAAAAGLVGDRLHCYEKLPRDEFIEMMASHDVYLSAARSDSFPVTLIEAMALGLIPVVADIPGVREWLPEGAGYTFPPRRAAELRSIVAGLVERGDPHQQMRRDNLERVRGCCLFEENIGRQIRLMREVAQEWKP